MTSVCFHLDLALVSIVHIDRTFATLLNNLEGIGRRFALTEAVGFISHLLLKWRIEPIFKDGETPAQWRKRVMVADMAMTLGVSNIPVRLVARA